MLSQNNISRQNSLYLYRQVVFNEVIKMMKIKVFSDMVCPYCYVGKLRLDQAIERLGLTDVEVEFSALPTLTAHGIREIQNNGYR